MPAISFSLFRDKILDGSKRQTIRAIRKNPIKEGETLYLWWKQRSPQREKLGEAKCQTVQKIAIYKDCLIRKWTNFIDELIDHPNKLDNFAIADGFSNWQELIEFFGKTHGLPFKGVLIQWNEISNSIYGDNFGKPITDTCPCGEILILDCSGECGHESD